MKTQTMPNMIVFQTWEQFKVLKVTGTKGMEMPSHLSIKEAVAIILKREAVLKLTNKEIHLKKNESTIIPAKEPHILMIKEDLEANVIMAINSEIKFITN